MFPLSQQKVAGYRFMQPTSYSKHHLGTDFFATTGTPLYAPFNGQSSISVGTQGGNTITFKLDSQPIVMRFMHLQTMKSGHFNESDQIGTCDNTGNATSGVHLHLDISKNKVDINNLSNFLDPEKFDWKGEQMTEDEKLKFAQALCILRTGTIIRTEVEYLIGQINAGTDPQIYARTALKDSIIPDLWTASSGTDCPQEQKDFWDKYFKDNPSKQLIDLARQWYNDYVAPLQNQIKMYEIEVDTLKTNDTKLVQETKDKTAKETEETILNRIVLFIKKIISGT